jgi:hypothetical protein
VTPSGGFNGNVQLSVSGVPNHISYSFSPSTVLGGAGLSTFTVSQSNKPMNGTYTLTIKGTNGSQISQTTVVLICN